ncbi:hypothetical protein DYB30_006908 [Aphanomyces astaci]|uniref:XMAP215/Dis1/CLASP TOG domain-containing protein n=1 Tax=Aphanomyces astaci TaxID=112090 RepID=A0A397DJ27_APHAT|nr:hypothetical protein DYB30_006908 [Aphanomyces astaci]
MTPKEAEKLEALAQDGWSSSIETNSQSAKWTERKAGFEAPLQMEEVAAKSLARTGEVVDKGFSGRPGAVNLAEEVVLEFVHLCSAKDTIAVLLEGSRNKRPKVLPLCVSSILACFKAFGPRTVPVAAVKKEFKALCESTVNNVRPNAVKLMGESPTNQWLLVDRYCPRPAKEAQEGVRPGEFADTINLLDRLPKTEFKAKMALSKWSEKVDALKIILDIVGSVPKLETGDYNDLVQTLKT